MADPEQDAWWRGTKRLAILTLAAAAVFIAVFAVVAQPIEGGVLGFPFAYFTAVLPLPFLLVALIFWFARRQEAIDRRHGLSED
jgi:putative solute:sodium symporter small subunit